jgi:hypothetical protein
MQKAHMIPALIALLLFFNSTAFATPVISISSGGNGMFVVQGTGFDKVAAAKVTVVYDTTTLANPRVMQGSLMSGALMASNTGFPGTVTLALMTSDPKGFSGSGPIATISFDLPGSSLGVITSLTAELASASNGAKLEMQQPQIYNPSGTNTSDSAAQQPSSTNPPATTPPESTTSQPAPAPSGGVTGPSTWLGDVTMPSDGSAAKEKTKVEAAAPSVPAEGKETTPGASGSGTAEPARPAPDTPEAAAASTQGEQKVVGFTSVLERFRTFSGGRTSQALIALFTQNDMQGISQEPPVALSDGITTVKVLIKLSSPVKGSPNFSLKGAKLVSLKMSGNNIWVVESLPRKGVYEATVNVLRDGSITEIPLTVAPSLPKGSKVSSGEKLTEADVNRFLKERGTVNAPRFDLNGDGKSDYIDDYILTANYLVQRDSQKKATTKEQK